MKRHWMATAVAAVLALGCAQVQRMTGMGWETLIDGDKGLENFNQVGDANWHAEGGAIVADKGKSGFLVSKNSYKDFEIHAEFYAESDTNSGIYLRCENPSKPEAATCYEVNVWDIRPDPKYATAAIVNVAAVPVPIVYKAGGKWNTFDITAKGSHLTVKFNGVTTADTQDSKHAAGPFGLQMGPGVKDAQGGAIQWRKVQIRPL